MDCYFSEVNRISDQCIDLGLLVNAGKTNEMFAFEIVLTCALVNAVLVGTLPWGMMGVF